MKTNRVVIILSLLISITLLFSIIVDAIRPDENSIYKPRNFFLKAVGLKNAITGKFLGVTGMQSADTQVQPQEEEIAVYPRFHVPSEQALYARTINFASKITLDVKTEDTLLAGYMSMTDYNRFTNRLLDKAKTQQPPVDLVFYQPQATPTQKQIIFYAVSQGVSTYEIPNTQTVDQAKITCRTLDVNTQPQNIGMIQLLLNNPSYQLPNSLVSATKYLCIKTADNGRVLLRHDRFDQNTAFNYFKWSYVTLPEQPPTPVPQQEKQFNIMNSFGIDSNPDSITATSIGFTENTPHTTWFDLSGVGSVNNRYSLNIDNIITQARTDFGNDDIIFYAALNTDFTSSQRYVSIGQLSTGTYLYNLRTLPEQATIEEAADSCRNLDLLTTTPHPSYLFYSNGIIQPPTEYNKYTCIKTKNNGRILLTYSHVDTAPHQNEAVFKWAYVTPPSQTCLPVREAFGINTCRNNFDDDCDGKTDSLDEDCQRPDLTIKDDGTGAYFYIGTAGDTVTTENPAKQQNPVQVTSANVNDNVGLFIKTKNIGTANFVTNKSMITLYAAPKVGTLKLELVSYSSIVFDQVYTRYSFIQGIYTLIQGDTIPIGGYSAYKIPFKPPTTPGTYCIDRVTINPGDWANENVPNSANNQLENNYLEDDICIQINQPCTQQTFYKDTDGDGYGTQAVQQQACTQPPGYVNNNQDCNDNDATVYPGARDFCDDRIDQDCDGTDLACPPQTEQPTTPVQCDANGAKEGCTPVCSESDEGKNYLVRGNLKADYYDKMSGTVHHVTLPLIPNPPNPGPNQGYYSVGADMCMRGNNFVKDCTPPNCILQESYCDSTSPRMYTIERSHECTNGCKDGACLTQQQEQPPTTVPQAEEPKPTIQPAETQQPIPVQPAPQEENELKIFDFHRWVFIGGTYPSYVPYTVKHTFRFSDKKWGKIETPIEHVKAHAYTATIINNIRAEKNSDIVFYLHPTYSSPTLTLAQSLPVFYPARSEVQIEGEQSKYIDQAKESCITRQFTPDQSKDITYDPDPEIIALYQTYGPANRDYHTQMYKIDLYTRQFYKYGPLRHPKFPHFCIKTADNRRILLSFDHIEEREAIKDDDVAVYKWSYLEQPTPPPQVPQVEEPTPVIPPTTQQPLPVQPTLSPCELAQKEQQQAQTELNKLNTLKTSLETIETDLKNINEKRKEKCGTKNDYEKQCREQYKKSNDRKKCENEHKQTYNTCIDKIEQLEKDLKNKQKELQTQINQLPREKQLKEQFEQKNEEVEQTCAPKLTCKTAKQKTQEKQTQLKNIEEKLRNTEQENENKRIECKKIDDNNPCKERNNKEIQEKENECNELKNKNPCTRIKNKKEKQECETKYKQNTQNCYNELNNLKENCQNNYKQAKKQCEQQEKEIKDTIKTLRNQQEQAIKDHSVAYKNEIEPCREYCNGIDDNLDGIIDNNIPPINCGVGECRRTIVGCINGKQPTCTPGTPTTEICGNKKDENCDGSDSPCPTLSPPQAPHTQTPTITCTPTRDPACVNDCDAQRNAKNNACPSYCANPSNRASIPGGGRESEGSCVTACYNDNNYAGASCRERCPTIPC